MRFDNLPERGRGRQVAGFSLLELLAVMAVVIVLCSLAAASISGILMGSNLTRAGNLVADQCTLARQEAVTRNRNVEVRFFYLPREASPAWRGMQVVRIEENGNQVPVGKLLVLPEGILISASETLSPLMMAGDPILGTVENPTYGTLSYRAFRFRPNGSTGGALGAGNFLTLCAATAQGSPPANFCTVQVNPVTGKITTYRP